MRIGFLLPTNFALVGPGNGVRVQAMRQADTLERAGHEVVRFNPWQPFTDEPFDAVQFFVGGLGNHMIERVRPSATRTFALAPIIDSNEPNRRYRMAARLGALTSKVYTVPGVLRDQARASDVVICRSQYEKRRVVDGLGIPESKAEIVLNGVDPPQPANPDLIRQQHDLPDEFALHVSSYTQERKNAVRLAEAVGELGYPLVLAGSAKPGPILDQLTALAARHGNIHMLGFLDLPLLNSLYAACKIFCLPSSHEGTGLAALEAAVYGASIVITQNGGPKDYFLDHAQYVDPFDATSIRTAVEAAWIQPRTDSLRNHLLQNLTWDASAAALCAAYRRHGKP